MKTLAERLTWARKQKGLRDNMSFTQADLAKRAGVTQGSIGHLESGRTETTRELTAIAAALGIDPRWLSDGVGAPTAARAADVTHIQRVNSAEAALLDAYRLTDDDGRGAIDATADLQPKIDLARDTRHQS